MSWIPLPNPFVQVSFLSVICVNHIIVPVIVFKFSCHVSPEPASPHFLLRYLVSCYTKYGRQCFLHCDSLLSDFLVTLKFVTRICSVTIFIYSTFLMLCNIIEIPVSCLPGYREINFQSFLSLLLCQLSSTHSTLAMSLKIKTKVTDHKNITSRAMD